MLEQSGAAFGRHPKMRTSGAATQLDLNPSVPTAEGGSMNFEKVLPTLVALTTTWGVRVVGVLVALFVAWRFADWCKRSVIRMLEHRTFDVTLTRFFGNTVRYLILVFALLGCLGVFGI